MINPYNDTQYDYTFCKENIEDITYEDLRKACLATIKTDIETLAPLGFSSKEFCLYGYFIPYKKATLTEKERQWKRVSMITIRIWNDLFDFLMTDINGEWLIHIQTQKEKVEDAINYLWEQFCIFKDEVDKEHNFKEINLKITDKTKLSTLAKEIIKNN